MTVREAIENALEFIEATHGHKDGAVYDDLKLALAHIVKHPEVANREF